MVDNKNETVIADRFRYLLPDIVVIHNDEATILQYQIDAFIAFSDEIINRKQTRNYYKIITEFLIYPHIFFLLLFFLW